MTDTLMALSTPLPGAPDLSQTVEPIFSVEVLVELRKKLSDIDEILSDGDLSTRAARIGSRRR